MPPHSDQTRVLADLAARARLRHRRRAKKFTWIASTLAAAAAIALAVWLPTLSSPPPAPVAPAPITPDLAGPPKRIEFSGTPLSEAIALFNRQNPLQLSLADPALGTLRVSGLFSTDDPAGFARLIEPALSLRARRVGPDRIELGR